MMLNMDPDHKELCGLATLCAGGQPCEKSLQMVKHYHFDIYMCPFKLENVCCGLQENDSGKKSHTG